MPTVLAVLAGYIVMAVLVMAGTIAAAAALIPGGLAATRQQAAGLPPRAYLSANLILSVVAAIVGGWVTVTIAPQEGRLAIAELAVLVIVLGIASERSERRRQAATSTAARQPTWYPVTITALGVVGAIFGGWLRLHY